MILYTLRLLSNVLLSYTEFALTMKSVIRYLFLLLNLHLIVRIRAADAPVPLQLLPSTEIYGPDGPWQAVSVQVGSPGQKINLYPGGTYGSWIFTNEACDGMKKSPCGSGGLFNPSKSGTIDESSILWSADSPTTISDFTSNALDIQYSNASYILDQLIIGTTSTSAGWSIANLSIIMVSNISVVYPNGIPYPLQLGELSLGAASANRTFSTDQGEPPVNASLVPGYLAEQNIISSSSFGLHIGSAALRLPLSLWFGGYDASRIVGPVLSRSFTAEMQFEIDLFDIGIGVDDGGSPFPYSSQSGFLASGNYSILDSISVAIYPATPYLNLPYSTCAAIAKELPVTYSSQYGLYFWNVQDPQCTKIVNSPTYLSFIFYSNMTIKVLFKLLNLTLEAPLISEPTQYFPCQPPQSPLASSYSLGRAFLQAAFVRVNWESGNGKWFLAQAPGPDIGNVPNQMPITSTTISATPDDWASTWKGELTPLLLPGAASSSPSISAHARPTEKSRHLAPGADAGIAIGATCAFMIALIIDLICYRRRKSQSRSLFALPRSRKDDGQSHNECHDSDHKISPHSYTTTEP